MAERLAVVVFNLGGPDSPEAIRPFLFNLFNDPAIIEVPWPMRWVLARLISGRRAPIAREIYANIGGRSPLLEQTTAQADALDAVLAARGHLAKTFIAMRYWHPMTEETVAAVKAWGATRVVLLPLYPQFSSTTSGSSLNTWRRVAAKRGLDAPTAAVCCYPTLDGWVAAAADRLDAVLPRAAGHGRPRVLFSAHGLPKKVVAAGDPYQWQVERTAAAILARSAHADVDAVVCYQSRVGPLEWIGPSTEDEIRRAGADRVPVVLVPHAFVSEHSETLVELDIEYRELAEEEGVPAYLRVPTVQDHPAFVGALADLVEGALAGRRAIGSQDGGRLCPVDCGRCPTAAAPAAVEARCDVAGRATGREKVTAGRES